MIRPCPIPLSANDDNGWLGREPTQDEQEIVAWLEQHDLPEKILHVGVGNALLYKQFGSRVKLGLSRDGGEVAHAKALGLQVVLCNKYDVSSYAAGRKESFDCIVDPNVRSYSCCTEHFLAYMARMRDLLASRGVLLTSKLGLAYLVPTSLAELRTLCPDWTVSTSGNVVIMRLRLRYRLRRWWTERSKPKRDGSLSSLDYPVAPP